MKKGTFQCVQPESKFHQLITTMVRSISTKIKSGETLRATHVTPQNVTLQDTGYFFSQCQPVSKCFQKKVGVSRLVLPKISKCPDWAWPHPIFDPELAIMALIFKSLAQSPKLTSIKQVQSVLIKQGNICTTFYFTNCNARMFCF